MNEACLSKLGWKLHNGDEKLWRQVVWGKYGRQHDHNNMIVRNADSNFWKCMVKIWPRVVKNSLWYVSNGVNIDAWNDHLLAQDMGTSIPMQLYPAQVGDLVEENGDWDWDALDSWLSEDVRYRSASMVPPSINVGPDEIVGV
ncbi:unnamed protein product [Lathyrus oleraceus]